MFEVVVAALCAAMLGYAIARFFRTRGKKAAPVRRSSPLDSWVEEQVAASTAKKLRLERDTVIRSLRGEPDPDGVSELEQGVRRIQLVFERMAVDHEIELRVEIAYEGGGQDTAVRRLHWDEVPGDIQSDFERTGAAHVYRPYEFPWSR